LQQKLQTLGMFNGNVDGIFGPKTARAIKAFEASIGRPQKGVLSTELVAMVRDADVSTPAPIVPRAPVVTQQVAPAQQTVAVTARAELPEVAVQATVSADPLPAPAPLIPASQKSVAAQTQLPAVQAPTEDDTAESAIQVATAEPEEATPAPLAMAQPNAVPKRTVQTIAVRATQAPAPTEDDAQQMPEQIASANDNSDASNNSDVVSAIQRGLNSLGFLHAKVSGVADEATAKAIRNFEVYFNYNVTGRVTKQLVGLLEQNGAVI
jgi:peptidoglycan hydrolase-like protein with peptidoglycan-binding domain